MTGRHSFRFLARALLIVVLARGAVASASSPLPARPAGGVVGHGPGTCDDAALTAALAGGGTITFNCGGPATILVTSAKTISASTTLLGGGVITLTGGSATRLFNVDSDVTLDLQHIVLDHAASTGSGGGAIANSGALVLDSVTIQNSHTDASNSGGAISSVGPVTVNNSRFLSNTASNGGALYAFSGLATVDIRNSTFTNNQTFTTSNGLGGAIWLGNGARLTVTDGQIFENVGNYGGALYQSPSTDITLTSELDLEFVGNTARRSGGAIYNEGGTLRVLNASLIGNVTPFTTTVGVGLGAGIASFGPLALSGDQIIGNSGSRGGGVYVSSTVTSIYISIDRTNLIGNYAATRDGGGLFIGGQNAVATIVDSAFTGNVAQGRGAGLYRDGAYLTINRSSFSGNVAFATGAGLYLTGPTPSTGEAVLLRDTTINANTNVPSTTTGAGIENLAQAQLTNVTLKDNSGGLLTGVSATTTLANTVLDNKIANCSGDLPVDNLGNFATNISSCGFAPNEIGHAAKLGPESFDPHGLTAFYLPQPGSPLIGAAISACSPRDQRRALRPAACDTGAVQHDGLLPWLYLALVER